MDQRSQERKRTKGRRTFCQKHAMGTTSQNWWSFDDAASRHRRRCRSGKGADGMVATTRPSASRRGPVKQAALAQMTCAVLAMYALAAPVVRGSYMHAPEAKHVRTMLGCTPRVLMYPTVRTLEVFIHKLHALYTQHLTCASTCA